MLSNFPTEITLLLLLFIIYYLLFLLSVVSRYISRWLRSVVGYGSVETLLPVSLHCIKGMSNRNQRVNR